MLPFIPREGERMIQIIKLILKVYVLKLFYKIYKDLDNIAEYIENIEKSMGKFIPKCPGCYEKLTFLMPDGQTLYCNKCRKYYKNE